MAKPSTVPLWATNTNYPATSDPIKVEPSTGVKEAGWAPTQKPPAQWVNWFWNAIYLWLVWLDAFESTEHTWTAVQTFATSTNMGDVSITGEMTQGSGNFNVGGPSFFTDLATFDDVDIVGALDIVGNVLITGNLVGNGTGVAATFTGNGANAGVIGQGGATGAGGVFTGGGTSGAGVAGQGGPNSVGGAFTAGAGNGNGVTGEGTGTGFGGLFEADGAANAVGLRGVGGNGGTSGVGVQGVGGTTNGTHGVVGQANCAASGFGVQGNGAGGTDSSGVQGNGAQAGAGGQFNGDPAGTGYGLMCSAKTAAPVRAAFRIAPQSADPTTPLLGDIYVNSGDGTLRIYNGAAWVKVGTQT